MGVLNVTPDSFSNGGYPADLDLADQLVAAGADILDIGGESTRPGSGPVSEDVEIARVIPLIAAIRRKHGIALSIDTMKPGVARAAMAAGAILWNDVTALSWAPHSLAVAADLACPVVLTHMRGVPATMQVDPRYDDVVAEVVTFLADRARAAIAAGVTRENIWLDPGIGFGKTTAHNLSLLGALNAIVDLGFPVLLGASRKGFIRAIDPTARDPGDRLGGSVAAALAGARAGVAMVRVHDVRETVQALAVAAAIRQGPAHG
jgi:dihydropteroate synthase